MNRSLSLLCAAGLVLLSARCSPPPPPPPPDTHDADVQAIKDNEAQWNKDYAAKDLEKIIAHYADDATLIVPGAPSVTGRDAVKAALKEFLADPALTLKFQTARVEVAKSGDVGFSQGSYTMTMTDPATKKPINDKGSYVTTYRKQADGTWRALSDIASSETPPGPPPASKKSSK